MKPTPARYEMMKITIAPYEVWGVWASFCQSFVENEKHSTPTRAIQRAGQLNRAYEAAMSC